MGDYQLLAGQLLVLFEIAVGGAAFWSACHIAVKLAAKDLA